MKRCEIILDGSQVFIISDAGVFVDERYVTQLWPTAIQEALGIEEEEE